MQEVDLFAPTPKPKERQGNVVTFRMNPQGIKWLDAVAEEAGVTRTEVVKAALAIMIADKRTLVKKIKERQS